MALAFSQLRVCALPGAQVRAASQLSMVQLRNLSRSSFELEFDVIALSSPRTW